VRHASIARTRAFAGVLRAYALALVPLAAIAAGMVLLVEMSYRPLQEFAPIIWKGTIKPAPVPKTKKPNKKKKAQN